MFYNQGIVTPQLYGGFLPDIPLFDLSFRAGGGGEFSLGVKWE